MPPGFKPFGEDWLKLLGWLDYLEGLALLGGDWGPAGRRMYV